VFGQSSQLPVKHDCALALIDPSSIRRPRWTGFDDWVMRGPEFDRLKSSIECLGGNLQPIKLRSNIGALLPFDTGAEPDGKEYEIVFGYSRLQACTELGLPVFAMVEPLSELEVVQQFASEFCAHPNWRPWRLGQVLKRTIDEGLFPSARKAAQALSMDLSEFALLIDLAALPLPVRVAFDDVGMQPSQGRKLTKAYQRDPESVSRNAREQDFDVCRTASAVLSRLTECHQ
jgi:ParB family chromosome partitioning protein